MRTRIFETWAEEQKTQNLEQHLGAVLSGIGRRIVRRGDLDDVSAEKIQPLEASKERQSLPGSQASDFGRPRPRRESGIEGVDIERQVSGAIADDASGAFDRAPNTKVQELVGVNDRHSGLLGKLPQIFRRSANADLDGSGRV